VPGGRAVQETLQKDKSLLDLYDYGRSVPIAYKKPMHPERPYLTTVDDLASRLQTWTADTGNWRSICEATTISDSFNSLLGFVVFLGLIFFLVLILYALYRVSRRIAFSTVSSTDLTQPLLTEGSD
jgi:hypothetical protein